jgi:septum formation protein
VRLYLASTSPSRLATLRATGVEPVVLPSHVDEEGAVEAAGELSPTDMVQLLARLKAQAVTSPEIDGFILGCDSAFELDGQVYGKPHTAAVARERWNLQRGREGQLHSGHWLIDHRGGVLGEQLGAVSSTFVRFAGVTDTEIDAYIATGEPLEVAGAFTIDSLGAGYITEIRGDAHSVVGVSVATLRSMLAGFGVEWHRLWNRGL